MATFNPHSSQSTKNYWLLAIMLVICYGFHLRYATLEMTDLSTTIHSDAEQYYVYAWNLRATHIYSKEETEGSIKPRADALRPPVFPFFAAALWDESSHFVLKVLWGQTIIQIMAFMALTLMLYRKAQGWIALIGSIFIWTFPHFISIDMFFLTESLFLSVIAAILSIALKDRLSILDWTIIGLLCGIGALTRYTLEYFSLFLFIILLIKKQLKREHIYFLAASLIPIIGWKIRNYFAIGGLSDPTLTINGLYHGSFPDFMFNHDPKTQGYAYRFDPDSAKVYQGVGATLSIIWERVIQSPTEYLQWYLIGKQKFLWQWNIFEGLGDIYIYYVGDSPWLKLPDMIFTHDFNKFLHKLWVAPALAFSVYLFFKKTSQQNDFILICTTFIVFCILLHAVTAPYTRYGIPFKLPLMLIFLVALDWGWGEVKLLKQQEAPRI
jgi:hypothetical protein